MSASGSTRRIAPALSLNFEETSSPQPSATPPILSSKSGIKRASTACQSCKQIKRKCDQQQPCSNCVKTGAECFFDQGQDGRRRAARKRNVEELENKRDALDTILAAIRNSSDGTTTQLLTLIKNDAPLNDIIQYASDVEQELSDQTLLSAADTDPNLSRPDVLDINFLVDRPPYRVPAAPWTTVTRDNDLVSHLISTYCIWYHPAYPCLVRDLFISEMNKGDLVSKFCSPALVNSILALACHFSDRPGAFKTPGKIITRGQHFREEALRMITIERGNPKVTTLQAGQILAASLVLSGNDRLGVSYIDQMNTMADDLLFTSSRVRASEQTPDTWKSLSLATWSLYILSVGYNLSFMRARSYSLPRLQRPDTDDRIFGTDTSWMPYPKFEPEINTDFEKFATMLFDLHQIGAEIGSILFNSNTQPIEAFDVFQDLTKRLEDMGQKLDPIDGEIRVHPHLMDLLLVYHWLRVVVFHFGTKPDSPVMRAPNADDLPSYARRQCLQSAHIMADLYKHYFHDFGAKNVGIWIAQTAPLLAYMLLENLDDLEVQEIFHEVCITIANVSRRMCILRGHARMVLITAHHRGQTIPEKTRQYLYHIAVETWGPEEHKSFDASISPNYTLAKGEDPRAAGMGDLLEQWANLSLRSSRMPIPEAEGRRRDSPFNFNS